MEIGKIAEKLDPLAGLPDRIAGMKNYMFQRDEPSGLLATLARHDGPEYGWVCWLYSNRPGRLTALAAGHGETRLEAAAEAVGRLKADGYRV